MSQNAAAQRPPEISSPAAYCGSKTFRVLTRSGKVELTDDELEKRRAAVEAAGRSRL